MVRPFRRADAVRVLTGADTAGAASAALIRRLRTELDEPTDSTRWLLGARAGGQAYTEIRRDVYHPLRGRARPGLGLTRVQRRGEYGRIHHGQSSGRGAEDPRRPGVARPARPGAGVAHARGLPERAVQVRQRVLRADGPELGPGRDRGHRAQQLRLQRDRAGLRHRRGRGAAVGLRPSARRCRQRGRAGPPLFLRPQARRPGDGPAAPGAVGDHGGGGRRSRVRRSLPEPAQPAPLHQPVRSRRRRQRAVRLRRAIPHRQGGHDRGTGGARTRRARTDIPTGGRSPSPPSVPLARDSAGARSTPRRRVSRFGRSTRSRT